MLKVKKFNHFNSLIYNGETISKYTIIYKLSGIVLDIFNALHKHVFADTTNYGISGIHQEFSKIITETDGLTRQGIQRFKIFFEEI